MQDIKITFIGVGNMATAIISGLIKNYFLAKNITATNKSLEKLSHLDNSIIKSTNNNAAICGADVIVLAVKPQKMRECIEQLNIENNPLIISLAAGITIASLESWLKKPLGIVRCMPNTPALINQGTTGLVSNAFASGNQKVMAEQILQSVGITAWLEAEALIDIVIAIAGSAPAYYFYLMEILQEFAEANGLDATIANLFIRQTCAGAGQLALQSELTNLELMRQVMSPGGTTEAAIATLTQQNVPTIVQTALKNLLHRSKELAG